MSDPVDALLRVREGDRVELVAKYYEFAAPYRVAEIDEETFGCPDGSVWRCRDVRLVTHKSGGRSSEYCVTAVYGADPPEIGSYGPLVDVSIVEDDDTAAAADGDEAVADGGETVFECPVCGKEYQARAYMIRHYSREHGDEVGESEAPLDRFRKLEQKSRGETA